MPVILHEDTFYEYFKPVRPAEAAHDIWGSFGLETYGKDLAIICRHDPAFVWTVVDGDTGDDQWIVPGVHYVNRVCYLISEIPHNWIDVEFRLSRKTSLTKVGLRRQATRLANYINAHQISTS